MERQGDRGDAGGTARRSRDGHAICGAGRASASARWVRCGSDAVLLPGAAAPALVQPDVLATNSPLGQIWGATPYLFFGFMLGASLWYVSRRLYGDSGGYIALTLYCFSPGMILAAAGTKSFGELGGTWGAFGTIFTAIAAAHTLYAPREVVLWNWRRIFLLGLSVALAVGTQVSLAVGHWPRCC